MPVRTKRLAQGNSSPVGASKVVYTAPAGETVILKDWRVYAPAGAVTRAILTVSSGDTVALLDSALASDELRGGSPWVVLHPGDVIRVISFANLFTFWLSGAELEGLAD